MPGIVEIHVRSCPGLSVSECMSASFAVIARITAYTSKLVDNVRTEFKRHRILHIKHVVDLEGGKG